MTAPVFPVAPMIVIIFSSHLYLSECRSQANPREQGRAAARFVTRLLSFVELRLGRPLNKPTCVDILSGYP